MLIISSKIGQLGNRLILSSHFIACAEEYKFTVINPAFEEYASYFQSTNNNIFTQYPEKRNFNSRRIRILIYKFFRFLLRLDDKILLRLFRIKITNLAENEIVSLTNSALLKDIKQSNTILFNGWRFRDFQNFLKHAEKIRRYFTPNYEHLNNVTNFISCIRATCDVLIGVHIRQGDYQEWESGKYFYTTNQYASKMSQIEKLFPDKLVSFIICSNIVQKVEYFKDFQVALALNHIILDMYSLSECDYIIGPPSTYSLWASFYGVKPLYWIENIDQQPSLIDFKPWTFWMTWDTE